MEAQRRTSVAVIGSGLAGLVSANLLVHDTRHRYAVTLFESVCSPARHHVDFDNDKIPQGESLSLDAASVSVPNAAQSSLDRIDVPMRAFAGGFYANLKALYDHLGVQYHSQPFLFQFATSEPHSPPRSHFVHTSNLHKLPPRLNGVGRIRYLTEAVYLLICYTWFSLCCFLVTPTEGEKLKQYLERMWIPERFVTFYLLPLISSVTTCPHKALLGFPASDMTEYKRRTHRAPHYTVSGGVKGVQGRLVQGIRTETNSTITAVEPSEKGVKVSWMKSDQTTTEIRTQLFDRVILAVAPDVVGRVFAPLQPFMQRIPTALVESIVHRDQSVLDVAQHTLCENNDAQLIHLRTTTNGLHQTESHHVQPSGAIVTTCPFNPIDPSLVLHSAKFTRVLRSPESQMIVNAIFEGNQTANIDDKRIPQWRNGDDNVWLVGGWCWDGMVLLEGCVVSAMRLADAFGVQVPWRNKAERCYT